jgi:hypothetical protein
MTEHFPHDAQASSLQPGAWGSRFRAIGRGLGRIVALAVIAAAGVAGWFAIDEYAARTISGSAVVAEVPIRPWPAELEVDAAAWTSFNMSYIKQDNSTQEMWIDGERNIASMVYSDAVGAAIDRFELAGTAGFHQQLGVDDWSPIDADQLEAVRTRAYGEVRPLRLDDLMSASGLRFVKIESDEFVGDSSVRRLTIAVDGTGFQSAEPIAFGEWRRRTIFTSNAEQLRWIVDVRPDGYIERFQGRYDDGVVENWRDLSGPVVLESSLAAEPAPTPIEPAPVDTTE